MPLADPSIASFYAATVVPLFVAMIILLVSFIISKRLIVGYPKIVSVEHNAIYIFHIYVVVIEQTKGDDLAFTTD